MLLFLPQIILGATFLILFAGNLFQRGFRSSWILSAVGSATALASLFFLKFQIPLSLSASAWWAGEGLVSSIDFSLDGISWQIAFTVCALMISFFLLDVHKAIFEPWLNWAAGLALAICSLIAIVAADFITLAVFWTLVDVISIIFIWKYIPEGDQRKTFLGFLPANIAAIFLLVAAGFLQIYGGPTTALLIVLALAFRLGIIRPENSEDARNLEVETIKPVLLISKAAALVLLGRFTVLEDPIQSVTLTILIFVVVIHFFRGLRQKNLSNTQDFENGYFALALASAMLGQPGIALGFGLAAMIASSLGNMAKSLLRFRWIVLALGLILLAGLPFQRILDDSTFAGLGVATIFLLLLQALLLACWLRQYQDSQLPKPTGEPWMHTIRMLGLLAAPVLFLIFVVVIPISLPIETRFIIWPPIVALVLSITFYLALDRLNRLFAAHRWNTLVGRIASLSWLGRIAEGGQNGLDWILHTVNRVLEGQAGILWALLLIALLLSVASQFAFGG